MSDHPAFQRYLHDESFRAALHARAHRERAQTVHRLILQPLLDLLRRPLRSIRRSTNAASCPVCR
ncbi:MAG: hypothetical protein OEW21_02205 [Betaproteobacteria bacterium]|nr:hypothetical protein [Betaproteobacteria bacterium]